MAKSISDRLLRLNNRRKGFDRLDSFSFDATDVVRSDAYVPESYERRSLAKPATRYALGAMQEVGHKYTSVCMDTAERVGKQLQNKLSMPVTFRLQGSVPLNVHIRAVSDVDLLTLDDRMFTYDRNGQKANWYPSTSLSSLGVLKELRLEAEKVLVSAYPAVRVDCTGRKAISLSGGSLARPVDVVPSHWHNTATYQATSADHERGVTILDKSVPMTLDNLPFLHIKKVHDRDLQCCAGLKKAIRLVKSVKSDSENPESTKLPSFDIAALLYHADISALRIGLIYELSVLAEAQRFFDWCYHNMAGARTLRTPDNSRIILDTQAKVDGLRALSYDLDSLVREVAREQASITPSADISLDQAQRILRAAVIQAAA